MGVKPLNSFSRGWFFFSRAYPVLRFYLNFWTHKGVVVFLICHPWASILWETSTQHAVHFRNLQTLKLQALAASLHERTQFCPRSHKSTLLPRSKKRSQGAVSRWNSWSRRWLKAPKTMVCNGNMIQTCSQQGWCSCWQVPSLHMSAICSSFCCGTKKRRHTHWRLLKAAIFSSTLSSCRCWCALYQAALANVQRSSKLNDTTDLGGGFKYFLFSPQLGEDSHFDQYFSDGLKPPTSDWLLQDFVPLKSYLRMGNH